MYINIRLYTYIYIYNEPGATPSYEIFLHEDTESGREGGRAVTCYGVCNFVLLYFVSQYFPLRRIALIYFIGMVFMCISLIWVCFPLFVGKEGCHMLRFVLYGFALFVGCSCHMSRFDLLCSCEREAVTRYGLFCFVLFRFVLFCSSEEKAATSYNLFCIVSFRCVLHRSVLLCIALLICGLTKNKPKVC